jgi:hypothetical protein
VHHSEPAQLARAIFLILLLFSFSAPALCSAGSNAGTALPPGTWGGRGIALEVLESSVRMEFDCAFGRIDAPLAVGAAGTFSAPGLYRPEPGGPGRLSDRPPAGKAALFSGEVHGPQMTLRVELPDQGRVLGPFHLEKSKRAELEKCL